MISILKASKFMVIIALLTSIAAVMASDNELEPGEEVDQRVQRAINAAPQVLADEDNLKWPMFTAGLCSVRRRGARPCGLACAGSSVPPLFLGTYGRKSFP